MAVLYHPSTLWPFSGSERRFVNVSKHLKETYNIEFDAIETTPTLNNYMRTFYSAFPVELASKSVYTDFVDWIVFGLKKASNMVRDTKYDFIYATNNNLYNISLGLLLSKLYHLPLIIVVHHFRWIDYRVHDGSYLSFSFIRTFELMRNNGLNTKDSVFRTLGAYAENLILEGAHSFITVSRTVAKQIFALGMKKRVYVTGNGISIDGIDSSVGKSSEKTYDSIYVGRLDEGKGVLDLLQVWKKIVSRLPQARLAIVGTGSLRAKAKSFVEENELTENVDLLDYLDDKKLLSTMQRARIFSTLSLTEGWGLAIAEALSCGLPVVAYDIPTLRETFGLCPTVRLVKEGDKEQFAQILFHLLKNASKENKESANASKNFARKFEWKVVAGKENAAILQTIKRRPMSTSP